MAEDLKVWMVEAGDVLDVMPPPEKQPEVAQAPKAPRNEARPLAKSITVGAKKRRAEPVQQKKTRLHFAQLVALTYLLGPLAMMLTPRGRAENKMVYTGLVSVAAGAILLAAKFAGLVSAEHTSSAWVWLALLTTAIAGGFTAWARALHLVGREGIPHQSKLPAWLGRSWIISALGLIAPGSGFLLSGRADRAAIVVWLMGPAVAASVILANVFGLWHHHQTSGWLASSGVTLEKTFVVAAAVAALGFLGYFAQALEGMRHVLVAPHLKSQARNNYFAVGALALVVTAVVIASPVPMAQKIGAGSEALRAEGFQTIPLRLSEMASNLDPANVTYAMQAVELYDELGETEKAELLRNQLDHNLGSYVDMVKNEAKTESSQVKPAVAPVERRESIESDALVGAMARSQVTQAEAEAPVNKRVTQGLGMPYGMGTSGTNKDTLPANEKPDPGK